MVSIIEVRKTYKYRLYGNVRTNRSLHDTINISGIIWNHITALRKRYYRRFRRHLDSRRLQSYVAKLRRKTQRFSSWQKVGSQAVQDICQRHDKVYERFFKKEGGLPRFKKVKAYTSFTLKQCGWKLGPDTHQRGSQKHPKWTGHITLLGESYKFVKHRPLNGTIKTVTVKRDAAGRLWICFSVVEKAAILDETSTGQSGGFDFGLKTFLTTNEGYRIEAPQFFQQDLPRYRSIQSRVDKKVAGSNNKTKGKRHLARRHIRIADKRLNFQFQLAHDLLDHYDTVVFEDLNIEGMKHLWGKKISDLGFVQFLRIVQWVAMKRSKQVIIIDQWERTTQKCSKCGHNQKLSLKERVFQCMRCGLLLDRDHNAAINILEAGHRLILSQSVEVPASRTASGAHGSRTCL